jgi:hypothetical protein
MKPRSQKVSCFPLGIVKINNLIFHFSLALKLIRHRLPFSQEQYRASFSQTLASSTIFKSFHLADCGASSSGLSHGIVLQCQVCSCYSLGIATALSYCRQVTSSTRDIPDQLPRSSRLSQNLASSILSFFCSSRLVQQPRRICMKKLRGRGTWAVAGACWIAV